MPVRAKFAVTEKRQSTNGYGVTLTPVCDGSEENKRFFKWTPSGEIRIHTINEEAAKELELGEDYYIDFTHAPKPAK